ncbi:MAG: L,D-transpeptidase [Eubacterium sp.]|nr:L,D-transpeptidase [Eubacterium sp.]
METQNPGTEVQQTVRNRRSRRSDKAKRRRRNRRLGALGVLCLLVLGTYMGGRYYFQSHFFPNTRINGVDCSLKNQEDAFDTVSDYLSTYKLIVHSEDGDLPVTAKDVGLSYKNSDDLARILKGQDSDQWFMNLKSSYSFQVMETKLDEKSLTRAVQSLACMNPSKPRVSENPSLVYNEKTGVYDVKEGELGNLVDEVPFTEAVKTAVLNGDKDVDLLSKEFYLPARYNESSPIIRKAKKTADKYVKSEIKYKDGDITEDITGKQIHKFVKINKKYKVSIDEEAVKKFVKKKIAKKFGAGDLVVIDSPGSGKIYVSDGDGDRVVNVPKEEKELVQDIKSGKKTTRKPDYITDFLYSSRGDIVKHDYIDINLSRQRVYVVIDDKIRVQSDCVTGNVSTGHGSSTGIYKIAYKTTNHTMVKYNAFVYYWMPYETTYGIGLHDATWRGSFGGTIYRYNGSHGCINLPLTYARRIYQIVYAGMPVVVHY